MTVRRTEGGPVELVGDCPIEDAEALLGHLRASPQPDVDWSACDHAHTAVIQVLLAAGARMIGEPRGRALAQWVASCLGTPET